MSASCHNSLSLPATEPTYNLGKLPQFVVLFSYLFVVLLSFSTVELIGWLLVVPLLNAYIKGATLATLKAKSLIGNSIVWLITAFALSVSNLALGVIVFAVHLIILLCDKEALKLMEKAFFDLLFAIKGSLKKNQ